MTSKSTSYGITRRSELSCWFFLIFLIVLVIGREPLFFIDPRFYGDEGVFYGNIFNKDRWDSLFMPFYGYYSLFINFPAFIATFFPVDYAPYFTTYSAFIVQMVPSTIVLFGNSTFWGTLPKKFVIAGSIPFLPFPRMWLTTTYIQFTFAVITFLILLENNASHRILKKMYYRFLLIAAGLTGVVSCFLTPVYLLKTMRTKAREDLIHTIILSISSLIQVSVFVAAILNKDPTLMSGRFSREFGMPQLWNIISFQFISPFYGWSPKYLSLSSITVGFTIIIYFFYLFMINLRDNNKQLMSISFFLVFFLSSIFSRHMEGGPRYAYAPVIIMLVLLVSEYSSFSISLYRRLIAVFLTSILIVFNISGYRSKMDYYSYHWPRWKEQVMIWKMNPDYPIKIWPQWRGEEWTIRLKGSEKK